MDQQTTEKTKISFIIPTKNNVRTIRKCLESLLRLNYKAIEILVCDGYSKDHTTAIINELGLEVQLAGPTRAIQKNKGLSLATGEFVMILDPDQYLPEDFCQKCLMKMVDGIDMLQFPELNPPYTLLNRVINWERDVSLRKRGKGVARFYRKKVFEQIGQFDEELVFAEDWDLQYRAEVSGLNKEVVEDIIIIHDEISQIWSLIKKYFYYGQSSFIPERSAKAKKFWHSYRPIDKQYLQNIMYFGRKSPWNCMMALTVRLVKLTAYSLGRFTQWLIGH